MYQLFSGARPAARPPSAAPPDFQHSHFRRSLYHEQPPQSLPSSGEDEEGLGLGTPFSADDDEISSGGGEGIAIDSTHYSDRSSARKRKLVEEQLCKLARVRLGDSIPRKSAGTSMGSSNLQSHIQPSSPLYNLSTGMARPLPCEGPDVNQPPGKRPRFFVGPKETSHRLVEVSRGGDSDSSSDDCERYVVSVDCECYLYLHGLNLTTLHTNIGFTAQYKSALYITKRSCGRNVRTNFTPAHGKLTDRLITLLNKITKKPGRWGGKNGYCPFHPTTSHGAGPESTKSLYGNVDAGGRRRCRRRNGNFTKLENSIIFYNIVQ